MTLLDKVLDRGGLNKTGRALQKHGDRVGSAFPKATRNHTAKNMQGQFHFDDILTHPSSQSRFRQTSKYDNMVTGNMGKTSA